MNSIFVLAAYILIILTGSILYSMSSSPPNCVKKQKFLLRSMVHSVYSVTDRPLVKITFLCAYIVSAIHVSSVRAYMRETVVLIYINAFKILLVVAFFMHVYFIVLYILIILYTHTQHECLPNVHTKTFKVQSCCCEI